MMQPSAPRIAGLSGQDRPGKPRAPLGLALLILVQLVCALFFLGDALRDLGAEGMRAMRDPHLVIETIAALSLMAGGALQTRSLMRLLRRQAHAEHALGLASGALQDVIETWYGEWRLTPAEQDVATFTLKGYSIAEVAGLRGSAEGTVKAHLNAIYRKANVTGRGQLVSLLLEELLRAPLLDQSTASSETWREDRNAL